MGKLRQGCITISQVLCYIKVVNWKLFCIWLYINHKQLLIILDKGSSKNFIAAE